MKSLASEFILIKKNKLKEPYSLSVGQKLLLPADFNKKAYSEETKIAEETSPVSEAPAKQTETKQAEKQS